MDTAGTLARILDPVIDSADCRPDRGPTAAILDEAARFTEQHLVPLANASDTQDCRIVDGRVNTADGHREAWRAFAKAGRLGLSAPEEAGSRASRSRWVSRCKNYLTRPVRHLGCCQSMCAARRGSWRRAAARPCLSIYFAMMIATPRSRRLRSVRLRHE